MSGTVSVAVTQGAQSTPPATLNIQQLPTVASYGVQPGQISHAFLIYAARLSGRRINELQAYQGLPGNTVNTSPVQPSLQNSLLGVISTRFDVDRVAADNTTVISGGSLANGTPIQFDQNSLDVMDRIIGMYITERASVIASASVPGSTTPFRHLPLANSGGIEALLSVMEFAGNETDLAKATSDYYGKDATAFDKSLAVASGAGALYGLAAGGEAGVAGAAYGALVSSVGLLHNLGMEIGDLAFIMVASRTGGDPAVIAEAEADIQAQGHDAAINTMSAELNLASIGTEFGAFGAGVLNSFLNSGTGQVALGSAALATSVYDCVSSSDGSCYSQLEGDSLEAAAETNNIFSSGFGDVTGTADITNNTGFAAALTEVELSSGTELFNTIADPNGQYNLFVPVADPNFDYSNATLQAYDPISNDILDTILFDLSGLTSAFSFQAPTMTGTCSDGDDDSDDPDCD